MLIQTSALILDTFREAVARKLIWVLFGLSTLLILFFLFLLKIDIVEGAMATVSLFGLQSRHGAIPVARLVRNTYGGIATFLYTWEMFFAVFASAGLTAHMLEPGRIELLLSKPVSRVHILLGRFVGNLLVITANAAYLVLAIWTIFGVKTGIWGPEFLWAIPTTVFTFAVLLSVVVLTGVVFESTTVATIAAVALMIISPILAQTNLMMRLLSSETSRFTWRLLYDVLPKVYDMGRTTLDLVRLQPTGGWFPVWSSALFGAVTLSAAIYVFAKRNF
jgi:ABC-2 type transport system permease protein